MDVVPSCSTAIPALIPVSDGAGAPGIIGIPNLRGRRGSLASSSSQEASIFQAAVCKLANIIPQRPSNMFRKTCAFQNGLLAYTYTADAHAPEHAFTPNPSPLAFQRRDKITKNSRPDSTDSKKKETHIPLLPNR